MSFVAYFLKHRFVAERVVTLSSRAAHACLEVSMSQMSQEQRHFSNGRPTRRLWSKTPPPPRVAHAFRPRPLVIGYDAQKERRRFKGEPTRRCRGKQPPPPKAPQECLPEPLVLGAEAFPDRKRSVYLVTLPYKNHVTSNRHHPGKKYFSKTTTYISKICNATLSSIYMVK